MVGGAVTLAVLLALALLLDLPTGSSDELEQREAAATAAAATAAPAARSNHVARRALRLARRAERLARAAGQRGGKGVAKAREALQKARAALQKGRTALQKGRTALQTGQLALETGTGALELAEQATARLDGAAIVSATASGTVETASELDYVALGGPQVTVTVPPSGVIELWATVRFEDPSDGLVALYEDGERVVIGGQSNLCGSADIPDALLSATLGPGAPVTLSTPSAALPFFSGCGTIGDAPASVQLRRPPGEHTYSLRYADCGCDPGAAGFSNRTLAIAGRP